jgi:hypothetical protein
MAGTAIRRFHSADFSRPAVFEVIHSFHNYSEHVSEAAGRRFD